MINEKDFEDILLSNIEYESRGYGYTPIESDSAKDISKKSFELAKQMAIEFAVWINKNRYCPTISFKHGVFEAWVKLTEYDDIPPGNIEHEELFNIYLNEDNKG